MNTTGTFHREVAVPSSIFAVLRRELGREAGDLPAIHALHAAGYAAGTEAAQAFRSALGDEVGAVGQTRFWKQLSGFLAQRGWGTLTHRDAHDAVGILSAPDWVEAGGKDEGDGCTFTAGFLSGMLTQMAGAPVAVLEVACRSRGDDRCDFAFGSEGAIHELYGGLLEGRDLSAALSSL